MITCKQLAEFLIDFVSGELEPEHQERIERHLQLCPPCVTYLETYKLTIRLTRKLPDKPLPPELVQQLRALLERECRRSDPGPGGRGA
jgi:anti-sigma factor RsiW